MRRAFSDIRVHQREMYCSLKLRDPCISDANVNDAICDPSHDLENAER